MNKYDDILNRIVEEFYDTGRLVLNEEIEFDVDNEDFDVESEEEIEIYDDEITKEKFGSINKMIDLISKKQNIG